MADNVIVNSPTSVGATIATEDVGGVQHQKVIIETSSSDGEATPVNAVNPLPVTASSLPLPTDAATSALQTTGNTSLSTIAGAVVGTEMQVDVITMPTTTVQATNLDIRDLVFASDKVDASGSVLGAGNNNIGDVDIASIAAGDNNIGNVDIVTMPNVVIGSGTVTAVTSVTNPVAVTQSGTWDEVGINDSGNSITVDAPLATPVFTTITPNTTGGWSTFMASSADGSTALTNSAQAIKGSAGTFGGYYIYNPNSVAIYVSIYNVAAASVTVGTTNPQNSFCIPPLAAANLEITNGINFSTAMSCAATTTGGGNTAPTTALEANFWYK